MGGVFMVAPTPDDRYKGWHDLMSVCRDSVERMSFDINTGEVSFHAAPPEEDTSSYLVAALALDPSGYTIQIHPRRASSFLGNIVDLWSSPPPWDAPVVVPLCARGSSARPITSGTTPPSTLMQVDVV